jgi:hypothetical protein
MTASIEPRQHVAKAYATFPSQTPRSWERNWEMRIWREKQDLAVLAAETRLHGCARHGAAGGWRYVS